MAILVALAFTRPMVGVIAFDWISFGNPQQESWGLGTQIPWALIAALATVIGCMLSREPKRWPVNAMTVLLLLFIVQISIGTAFAIVPATIVDPFYIQIIKSLVFLLLTAALLTTRRRLHAMVWLMVLAVGYYGVRGGVFAILTGGGDHVYGPPNSMIADNNQLAVALLVTLPLMNYLRLQSASRPVRIGLVAAMMLTLLAVLATYSRGGFLALGVMVVLFWWRSRQRFVSALALVMALSIGVAVMPAQWQQRMFSIQHYQKDASAQDRLTVWREAFGIALARPLTGAGFHATAAPSVIHRYYPQGVPRATHSAWFEVLSENGFPALCLWIAMVVVALLNLRWLRRRARGDPDLAWVEDFGRMAEVSIIAFLVGASFLSLAYYDYYFALLTTIAATRVVMQRATSGAGATVGLPRRVPAVSSDGWRARSPAR